MPKLTSAQLMHYTQVYIRDIFADLLRQEGFVSYKGEDICWYRVVNGEIVNSICFHTHWRRDPVSVEIGFGIHPLFIFPHFNPKVYLSEYPYGLEVMREQQLICKEGGFGKDYYSLSIPVYVPWGDDKGRYTLEGVLLPKMNSIQNARDCYELHKSWLSNRWTNPQQDLGNLFSAHFVDEGIWLEDKALYPYFREWADIKLHRIETLYSEKDRSKPALRNRLHQIELQKKVLLDGKRDMFLADLEQRKKQVVQMLENKIGISF